MATGIVQSREDKKDKQRPRNTRADGLKRIRLEIESDDPNKRKQKYFYGHTLAECNEKKRKYLNELEEERNRQTVMSQYGIDPTLAEMPFSAWVDRWESVYGERGGYGVRLAKKACCEKLRKEIGKLKLKDVRQMDIQRIAQKHIKQSKATVRNIKQVTCAVFRAAVQNHAIAINPCNDVAWEYGTEGTHRYLEDWEIALIVANWREHRIGIWVMLMLFAGLRRGEALALKWDDIDIVGRQINVARAVHFEGNTAVYGPPKSKAGIRSIPILPPLYEALNSLYGPPMSEYVCTGADGSTVSESAWSRGWNGFLVAMTNRLHGEQAIQPGRRPKGHNTRQRFDVRAHDLRHTFCSMLYDAGVDVKTAQKWMGHSTPEMTLRIYTHLSNHKRQEGLEKIETYTAKFTAPILPPNA